MVEDPEINEKGSLASLENIAYEKSGRDFAYFIDKYSARNGLIVTQQFNLSKAFSDLPWLHLFINALHITLSITLL